MTVLATKPETTITISDQARSYAANSRAEATKKAYRADMAAWNAFCHQAGISPQLPATVASVAEYVASMGGQVAVATIRRRLVTLSQAHKAAGLENPVASEIVRSVLKGLIREYGTAQRKAAPIRAANIRAFVAQNSGADLATLRDRALLLLGFFGALRRSELVALNVSDVAFTSEGMTITLRRSKTDQEGRGRTVGICHQARPDACPVRALGAWIQAAGIQEGPIFRKVARSGKVAEDALTGAGVAYILKAHAAALGLDESAISGHSLRRGFVTEAYAADVPTPEIQAVTGHRSLQVLSGYYAEANIFRNATARVQL
ncbi:MAG: site-specific integrase [Pseudanabaena sp.]|jgi:site-specific recombinase XerD